MPSAPCTCSARSSTRCSTPATWNLMSEMRSAGRPRPVATRSARPCRARAAAPRRSRPCDSAIQCWTDLLLAERLARRRARAPRRGAHISRNARSQMPIQRMQWWIRPGPSRSCARAKPAPSAPIRLATGTRTPSNRSLGVARVVRSPASPITGRLRDDARSPGASIGTMIWLARCVRLRVRGGDGHDDREGRAVGARREPLVAVDHVVVAVAPAPWSPSRPDSIPRTRARSSRSSCESRRGRAARASARLLRRAAVRVQESHSCRCPAPAR